MPFGELFQAGEKRRMTGFLEIALPVGFRCDRGDVVKKFVSRQLATLLAARLRR